MKAKQNNFIGNKQIASSIPVVLSIIEEGSDRITAINTNGFIYNTLPIATAIDNDYQLIDIQECLSCGARKFERSTGYKKCIYCGSEYSI